MPVALSDVAGLSLPFYVTSNDEGCSSLLKPKDFHVKRVVYVPVFTLEDFFHLLPLDSIEYIEYIKIDVQGLDFNVVKGASSFLSEKVVFVTAECEANQYESSEQNTQENLESYMKSIGFNEFITKIAEIQHF